MEEQLLRARKFKVPYSILMGDIEVKKGKVIVRDMERGRSETIDVADIIPKMEELLGKSLDNTVDFLGHN
jgi:histidyl-tRNA synthetase